MAKSSKVKKMSKKTKKVSGPKKKVKKSIKKSIKKALKKSAKPKKAVKKSIKKTVKRSAKSKKTARPTKTARVAAKAARPAQAVSQKKYFTPQEIKIFKAKLLDIHKKLTGDVSHLETDALMNTRDASGNLSVHTLHMADVATDNYDQELNLGLASSEQELLNRVENALKRIDEGTFGFSIKSGEPISKKRLNVVPYAELTIQEKEEEEKNSTRGV